MPGGALLPEEEAISWQQRWREVEEGRGGERRGALYNFSNDSEQPSALWTISVSFGKQTQGFNVTCLRFSQRLGS